MDTGRIIYNSNEIEMPLGYKFIPSSCEIFDYYLLPKIKGELMAQNYIDDLDVYKYDPQQLPLNVSKYARKDEAYFFVPITGKLLRGERTTPNGYWEILKEGVPIYNQDGDIIGDKNKLEFYNGKKPNGIKSNWKMVEYRTNVQLNGVRQNLMVCKVKLKVEEINLRRRRILRGAGSKDIA